jgi:hypothetical protein
MRYLIFICFLTALFLACDSDLPMVEESSITPIEINYDINDTMTLEVETRFGRKPIFFPQSSTLDTRMFGNMNRDQIVFNSAKVDSINLSRLSSNPYPDAGINGTDVYTNSLTVYYDDGTTSEFPDVYAPNSMSSNTYLPARNFYRSSSLKMARYHLIMTDRQSMFDIKYGATKTTILQEVYDYDDNLLASEYILADHPFAKIWNMPHEF